MEYTDSKRALINAIDGDNTFLCFKTQTDRYITVEIMPMDYPSTSLIIWNDVDEMLRDVTWHDWIVEGIKDNELRKQVEPFYH